MVYQDIRARYRSEHIEETVDDVLLAHQDGAENVGDHDLAQPLGIDRLATLGQERNKDRDVRDKNDAEQAAVQGEHLEAQVARPLALSLLWELVLLVPVPYVAFLNSGGEFDFTDGRGGRFGAQAARFVRTSWIPQSFLRGRREQGRPPHWYQSGFVDGRPCTFVCCQLAESAFVDLAIAGRGMR